VGEDRFDAFVSYAHEDAEWTRRLAENLHRLGIDVYFDEWEIRPGDVLVHGLDRGIRSSRDGVLVVSPAALGRPWVQEEYAAMMTDAVAGRRRVIPVLLRDAELPPLLASRTWVDFRDTRDPHTYRRQVEQLAATLRGEQVARPARDGQLVVPPDLAYRAEGPRRAALRVRDGGVAFAVDGDEAADEAVTFPERARERVWQLEELRSYWRPSEAAAQQMQQRLLETGRALGEAFLSGSAGAGLAAALRAVEGSQTTLRLGLEIEDRALEELPWETLTLPGESVPLVLHPRVALYRALPGLGATTAAAVAGPLRVLAVIASPERGGGELLDTEAELRRILDAVDAARREERAYARVLNWGTVRAIRDALQQERFHVLHVSCHALPGVLLLEDANGDVDLVDARRFVSDVLPPDRVVPLVVLSGCSTGSQARGRGDPAGEGEAALAGLARGLVASGVPAVLAMTARVSDRYAARLTAGLYRELAVREYPDPATALADVRREVQAGAGMVPEWATPALFVRGPGLALYDRGVPFEDIAAPPEPDLGRAMVVRRVGDFVGRRGELRALMRALRGEARGVVVHGLGGVGKSTLAAQIVYELGQDAGPVVALGGGLEVDEILDAIGMRLLVQGFERGLDDADPRRRLASTVREATMPWAERLQLLQAVHLAHEPLLLLLDNFEDNLRPGSGGAAYAVVEAELAKFLEAWLTQSGRGRLLMTSRHPFALPRAARVRTRFHAVGPLTEAETSKLMWRLPGLDRLDARERRRAYTRVGGHPRTLEYLDALLRGGEARFDDVAARMEEAIARRGIADPEAWLGEAEGDLDRGLAEAVTLSVDDVLLDDLLERLVDHPLARRLLLRASVYRLPVDSAGLAWQLYGEPDAGTEGLPDVSGAVELLVRLGLLGPVQGADEYIVHRWTAGALMRRMSPEEKADAHLRAATYWRLRAATEAEKRLDAIHRMLEAREHLHAGGDAEEAAEVTLEACAYLHGWGAWDWERRLCEGTLAWLPETSSLAARLQRQLAAIARDRGDFGRAGAHAEQSRAASDTLGDPVGIAEAAFVLGSVARSGHDYDRAVTEYRKALSIREQLGDQAGMAEVQRELGTISQLRGDFDEAVAWYERSLASSETAGDSPNIAMTYHELGNVAIDRGDLDTAQAYYARALGFAEQVGHVSGVASGYYQLGRIAEMRKEYDTAMPKARQALRLFEELGDRVGMGQCYALLAAIAKGRGDFDGMLEWGRRSLETSEAIGDRSGIASGVALCGDVARARGDYREALQLHRRATEIWRELGDRDGLASGLHEQGRALEELGDYDGALELYRQSVAIHEEIGDRRGTAQGFHQLGTVALRRGLYDEAHEWLRKSLALADELAMKDTVAAALVGLGSVALYRDQLDTAVEHFERSLAISEQLDDINAQGLASHQLGVVAQARGDRERALELYGRALAIAEQIGDRSGRATTLLQLSTLLAERDPATAIAPLLESLKEHIAMQSPDTDHHVRYLANHRAALGPERFVERLRACDSLPPEILVQLCSAIGDDASALALLRGRVADAGAGQPAEVMALNDLAAFMLAKGDYAGALTHYERSLALAEDAARGAADVEDLITLQAIAADGIGHAHVALDDPRAAVAPLTRALALLRKRSLDSDERRELHTLGLIHAMLGEHDKAIEYHTARVGIGARGRRACRGGRLARRDRQRAPGCQRLRRRAGVLRPGARHRSRDRRSC
jgi:tetratricopeptide (TPR) repeat protein